MLIQKNSIAIIIKEFNSLNKQSLYIVYLPFHYNTLFKGKETIKLMFL